MMTQGVSPETREEFYSTANRTTFGYHVQARMLSKALPPATHNGVVVTHEWTTLRFTKLPKGVPDGWGIQSGTHDPILEYLGFLSYPAALAMMGALESAAAPLSSGVEYRVAKVKVEWQYKTQIEGFGPAMHFWEIERQLEIKKDEPK